MRIGDRYELAAELGTRYWRGSRQERGTILDAFCLATGYHRKYAIAMLRGRRRVAVRRRTARARRYGPEFQKALLVAWEAFGYVCSERLQPFLPELVPLLEQHRHLSIDDATRGLLFQASVSTVERALAPQRKHLVGRRMAQPKPGTLLRRQIPALVGPWKAEDVPGYLEIDLVSHSGEYAAGTFLYTLSTVDLATGWTERIALLGKGQTGVVAGLDRIREQLPFRLRGLHPDTGSEFINLNLFTYCKERGIEFTRSRPYHKNDNCHVEQKNWTLVRRLIGYDRLAPPGREKTGEGTGQSLQRHSGILGQARVASPRRRTATRRAPRCATVRRVASIACASSTCLGGQTVSSRRQRATGAKPRGRRELDDTERAMDDYRTRLARAEAPSGDCGWRSPGCQRGWTDSGTD
jgi:hypothetical protein